MSFHIFHRHRVCLVDCVDLICSLYSWWEKFRSSSLANCPLVSIVVLSPPLHVGPPLGFASEAALEDLCVEVKSETAPVVLMGLQGDFECVSIIIVTLTAPFTYDSCG